MSDDNKPIGWWLKEVDRLLEESFEQVLAADGLTRRQWQALNAAAGPESIAAALAPFLTGDPAELTAVTDSLVERGWLSGDELTAAGRDAREALTAKVQALRRLVTAGDSDQVYGVAVGVLRRMTENIRGSVV